jgi:hypothetical protein
MRTRDCVTGAALFPGRRAGQPIHPGSLRLRPHRLGIPNLNGRIRGLLQQAPPAGYRQNARLLPHVDRNHRRTQPEPAGSGYAAGDHTRQRSTTSEAALYTGTSVT